MPVARRPAPFAGRGHDEIAALGAAVLGHYPAHTFTRTTEVDLHHGFARYGWTLDAPDGTQVAAGEDVAEIGPDGRLRNVVGFFGTPAVRTLRT